MLLHSDLAASKGVCLWLMKELEAALITKLQNFWQSPLKCSGNGMMGADSGDGA